MAFATIWKGDSGEAVRFQLAIEHNCTCEQNALGAPDGRCAAHRMMFDQALLDRILFARWMRQRLWDEERER